MVGGTPRNRELLAIRDDLQAKVDQWHRDNPRPTARSTSTPTSSSSPTSATSSPTGELRDRAQGCRHRDFADRGPQLVVPILNARFALNAANARWELALRRALRHRRDLRSRRCGEGPLVQHGARRQGHRLRQGLPRRRGAVEQGSHADATKYVVDGDKVNVVLGNDTDVTTFADPSAFVGYRGDALAPSSILLRHNGLHIDISSTSSPVGSTDPRPGSPTSTRVRDHHDHGLRGLGGRRRCRGTRSSATATGWASTAATSPRRLPRAARRSPACSTRTRVYTAPDGSGLSCTARSLLFVRNVGT